MKQTPEYVIGKMKDLHRELGEFLVYINMNREQIKNYREGNEAIETVSEMLEVEVQRLQQYIKREEDKKLSTGDASIS